MTPIDDTGGGLHVIDLERFDPGDGHTFWRATVDWCGVIIVFDDRWGCWSTCDFASDQPYEATGWLAEALDEAVGRRGYVQRGGET